MCAHYLLTSVSLLKKWMQEYSEEEVNGIEEVVADSEVAEPIGEETVNKQPKPIDTKKVGKYYSIDFFYTFVPLMGRNPLTEMKILTTFRTSCIQ